MALKRLYAEYTGFGLQLLRPHLSNAQDQRRVETYAQIEHFAPARCILMLEDDRHFELVALTFKMIRKVANKFCQPLFLGVPYPSSNYSKCSIF
jgi:hypothetical protein